MIHWGTSIPCTLYIDSQKNCDLHLPDTCTWTDFTSQVTCKAGLRPTTWYYTYTTLGAVQEIHGEEDFSRVKGLYRSGGPILQVNACTEPGGWSGPAGAAPGPEFDRAVEAAVQKYLVKYGAELVRDLAHRNKLCCCSTPRPPIPATSNEPTSSRDQSRDQSPEEFVFGDMVLETPAAPRVPPRHRKPEYDASSSKRPRVILGDRDHMLAPGHNNVLTVHPGERVISSWNVVYKLEISSVWDVREDGGTLQSVGDVTWNQITPNILEFSIEFVAPGSEGCFESRWTLYQDTFKRESFVFCKLNVQSSDSVVSTVSTLASHGNIPAETSVPKMLNNNKVFCVSNNS